MARLLTQPWRDRIPSAPAPPPAIDPRSGSMGRLENGGEALVKCRLGAPAPDPASICVSLRTLHKPSHRRARVRVFGCVHPVTGWYVVYNTPGE